MGSGVELVRTAWPLIGVPDVTRVRSSARWMVMGDVGVVLPMDDVAVGLLVELLPQAIRRRAIPAKDHRHDGFTDLSENSDASSPASERVSAQCGMPGQIEGHRLWTKYGFHRLLGGTLPRWDDGHPGLNKQDWGVGLVNAGRIEERST